MALSGTTIHGHPTPGGHCCLESVVDAVLSWGLSSGVVLGCVWVQATQATVVVGQGARGGSVEYRGVGSALLFLPGCSFAEGPAMSRRQEVSSGRWVVGRCRVSWCVGWWEVCGVRVEFLFIGR